RLAIHAVGLATDRVADARGREQVALVGRVDEDPAARSAAADGRDRRDAVAVLLHAAVALQPVAAPDREPGYFDEPLERGLGDVRLERPRGVVAVVVAAAAELVAPLVHPRLLARVVCADHAVELAR